MDSPDAAMINDRLQSKESPAALREFLTSSPELQFSGQELKAAFLECFFKRAAKSLEHVKRFVEMFFTDVFEPWFLSGADAKESQFTLLRTVSSVWQRNPSRGLHVVEKLYQIGLFDACHGVEWALQTLAAAKKEEGQATLAGSFPLQVVELIATRTMEKSGLLYTLYTQRGFLGSLALPQGVLGMQVDEIGGAHIHQAQLDLSLTRRLLLQLHPDAVSIPPAIPTLQDFQRVHERVAQEQDRLGALLVQGLVLQAAAEAVDFKSVLTVLRQVLDLVSKHVNAALESGQATGRAAQLLQILKALA